MPRRLSLVPLIVLTLVIVSAGSAGVQSQASASAAQEADAFYQKRDWANAAKAYRTLAESDPSNGRAWFRLGMSLQSLRRPPEAVEAYRTAIFAFTLAYCASILLPMSKTGSRSSSNPRTCLLRARIIDGLPTQDLPHDMGYPSPAILIYTRTVS